MKNSQLLELNVPQSIKEVESAVIGFSFSYEGFSVWTGVWVPHL